MAKLTIEDKRKIVEFYKEGFGYKVIARKIGITRARVQEIIRQHELFSDISLEVSHSNKKYTPMFKMELIQRVLNGESIWQVAMENMISRGQMCNWIKKYKELGYNGLSKPKGRPKIMK
jgi:transposase